MARYLPEEIYNEVSKIFRTRLEPGREGGTLNTRTEYFQLLEVAATTFLFNDGAIYQLAKLSSNSLTSLVRREVAILEDILAALEDLSQIGKPVVDTATLSNAGSALLALDSSASVQGRPETTRFLNLMDDYASKQRPNVVSRSTGSLARTREEARNVIRTNAERLTTIHTKLLDHVQGLRDMMDDFDSLDIPGRVSTNALLNIRNNLESLRSNESDWSATENLAASRKSTLTALSSKVAVNLLAEFTNPQELKYRSPNRPIPSTLKHLIKTVGTGEPAYADTGSAPWQFPISGILTVSVNGGSAVDVELDRLAGSVLNGDNPESFSMTTLERRRLHVILDRTVYNLTVSSATTTVLTFSEYYDFSFKHLGAMTMSPEQSVASDQNPRVVLDLRQLQSCAMTYNSSTLTATCGSFVAGDEVVTGFQSHHVGCYLKDSAGERFEIAEVVSSTTVVLSVPDVLPVAVEPTDGATTLHGQVSTLSDTKFTVEPAYSTPPSASDAFTSGPTIKTVLMGSGTWTAAQVVEEVQKEDGTSLVVGAAVNKHVKIQTVADDSTRVALAIRNRRSPFLQIGSDYPFVDPVTPTPPAFVTAAAHDVLGFPVGASLESLFDSNDVLSPAELGKAVKGTVSGVNVEELRSTITSGTTLGTTVGTKLVEDPGATFQWVGVAVNDVLIIESGSSAGFYQVTAVNSQTQLEISRTSDFVSSEANLTYTVFRWKLRISSQSAGTPSALLFSGASELGLPTTTQRGSIKTVEAVDRVGNKFTFNQAKAGDLLRLVGSQDEYEIESVAGTTLTLSRGLPSNTSGAGFEIRRGSAKDFESLNSRLSTFTTSPNLLKLNKFDEDLSELTNALISATLPGQNFAASRARANRLVMDLLSILTDTLLRSDEYSVSPRVAADNLLSILQSYSAPASPALAALIAMFTERRYDRSADLLLKGKMSDFFSTTEETGSYGGTMMQSSRTTLNDLPRVPTTQFNFERQMNSANRVVVNRDSEEDFTDTEDYQLPGE